EHQLAAVTLPAQHALVLAGAGSGKTRVLTTRIAWLVQTGNVGPGGLLGVTFTNKAAREMMTRIAAMLPINTRGMWVGTFHGLCNRFLRTHHRDAELPQTFAILDSQDQLAVVKRVMKSMNVDDEKFPARQVSWFIAAAKEEGKRPGQVEIFDDFSRKYAEIYRYYDELCQKEGTVDFAELLLRSFEVMSRNESIRTHYQNRFRHVLVDEFQDTNRLQYRWLKLLCGPETAMFAVGDDDQSIYRFRGANVGNMGDFERDFRVKNLIRLEQNYRSYGNILNAANALISNNTKRLGKNLWTEAGEGEPIRIFEAGSDGLEAAWVVEEIQALVRDGLARRDIALLYRSNAQSRILEHALFSQGISYRVYGGLRFFERQEVKHALAYLRLIANPDDDAAFLRVVNFPTRGIGARSIEQLQDTASAAGSSLWQATSKVAGKAGTVLGTFVRLIEKLRADTANRPLPEVVEQLLEASGLVAHYRTERDGADRVENLNELVNAAASFMHEEGLNREPAFNVGVAEGPAEQSEPSADGDVVPAQADAVATTPDDPLSAFLAHAALESGDIQAGEGSDAVQLMTVHSAKGLEFHVVFVTGLEEGLFPHDQSSKEEDGLEEERRLMYVAITRARTRLYLSFAQTRMLHGQTRYGVASRFVDELPKGVLKWLTQQRGRHLDDRAWASAGPPAGFKPRETAPGSPYRIGQSVKHAKFGEGVIVNAEGAGSDAKLQINFGPSGLKWLALEYAKLEAS
ncbi:MAG: UvrD-helicase domain-containing protein, partial [Burkholderiales bacterium]